MKPTDDIEQMLRSLRVATGQALDDRILNDSEKALAEARRQSDGAGRIIRTGRFLMHNTIARFAVAAGLLVAVGLAVTALGLLHNGTTAYVFGDTVAAMHSVQSLHLKVDSAGRGLSGELWCEFDRAGELNRCRWDCPVTPDGYKVILWRDGKASVWFKDKNSYLTIADQKVARATLELAMENDPRTLVSRLEQAQVRGEVRVETQAPAADGSIVLNVTDLAGSDAPGRRQVLHVDPATRLVTRVERFSEDGELLSRVEILAYNDPIAPAVFEPQLPQDITRIDQTTQPIGLSQGDMTDDEIAKEVVRQFFQALIDRDYVLAGRIFSGVPAARMEQLAQNLPVVRIVSIGEPTPHEQTRSLRVPVTVEVEKDGQLHQWSPHGPFVRRVESDPRRWQIIGGI